MGRKGDLLRAQKAQRTVYTFTREQLAQHDEQIISARMELIKQRAKDYTDEIWEQRRKENLEIVNREWNERKELFQSGEKEEDFFNMFQFLLCLSARVLVEKFKWKPIPKDGMYDRRNKLMQFSDALVDEIDKISQDETMDIRKYSDETFDLYGVKFTRIE